MQPNNLDWMDLFRNLYVSALLMEYSNIKQNRKVKTSGVCIKKWNMKAWWNQLPSSPSQVSTAHSSSQPSPSKLDILFTLTHLDSHHLPLVLFLQKTSIKNRIKVYFWNVYHRSHWGLLIISKQCKEAIQMTFWIRYQFGFMSWDVHKLLPMIIYR